RNCAAPAGVRSTTRLALASADVSSSLRYLTRRDDVPPTGTPGWAGGLSWPGCGCPAWGCPLPVPPAATVRPAAPVPLSAASRSDVAASACGPLAGDSATRGVDGSELGRI